MKSGCTYKIIDNGMGPEQKELQSAQTHKEKDQAKQNAINGEKELQRK